MRPSWGSLCQTTAVSVATILGTGILGLPVTLHTSGIKPFLLTFTVNLMAQLGVVTAMAELLQRAHHKHPGGYEPLQAHDGHSPAASAPPSLHSLAAHFIPSRLLRAVFNSIVLMHFLFILSAYALAGPQAYESLFPSLHTVPGLLPPTVFVVVSALLVIGRSHALLPSLTVGTAVKACLLTALVIVTLARGLVIHHHISTDWNPRVLLDPILMGTLALSGVVNLMPVTFQTCLDSLPPSTDGIIDAAFVSAYRTATVLAVIICYALNVAWSYGVLLVVPQRAESLSSTAGQLAEATANVTLANAQQLGQISTVPLMEVLQARNDALDWFVALLVNSFIALSVTISFLVMSVGMKHFIDGGAKAQSSTESPLLSYNVNRRLKYFVYFSTVLTIVLKNPAGLFKIMEGTTTLALNIEAGLFVIYMFYRSRTADASSAVPAPMSSFHAGVLISFSGLYFLFIVLIDLIFYIPSTFF